MQIIPLNLDSVLLLLHNSKLAYLTVCYRKKKIDVKWTSVFHASVMLKAFVLL